MSEVNIPEDASPTVENETSVGIDWPVDADGYPHRQAERIILINQADQVLLIKGHDFADPNHSWWFLVGGGKDPGEPTGQTVLREVSEETGIVLDAAQIEGPVLLRQAVFKFRTVIAKQDEAIFLARITPEQEESLNTQGWTASENKLLDELRWFSVGQLRELVKTETVYPQQLVEWLPDWLAGWDGHTRQVTES